MRLLLTALVAGALVVPAAHASDPYLMTGGCAFQTVAPPGSTDYTGVMYDVSVTTTRDLTPVDGTVWCEIRDNGVTIPGTTYAYSGFGVQAGADRLTFHATNDGVWQLCERDDLGGTTGWWHCQCPIPLSTASEPACSGYESHLDLVVEAATDAANAAVAAYDGAWTTYIDPTTCPVFAAHAGTYGPITITPDGDVVDTGPLALGVLDDCPPYDPS